jgi:oligo-1,6-glucosidase
MTNAGFERIEDYRDMPTMNQYQALKSKGGDLQAFMKRLQFECRDNGRTPFQWNAGTHAGFTTGTPWISVNKNYKTINAAAQEKDPQSVLNYFRKLTQLRRRNPILVYGKYTLLDRDNPDVYTYTRSYEGKTWLVMLNFSAREAFAQTGINLSGAKILACNYKDPSSNGKLRPYEAVIMALE